MDKKSAAETNKQKSSKQEAREPAQCVQPPAVEANALQNGEKTQKKSEKRRQSLGGFLKGLVSRCSLLSHFLAKGRGINLQSGGWLESWQKKRGGGGDLCAPTGCQALH